MGKFKVLLQLKNVFFKKNPCKVIELEANFLGPFKGSLKVWKYPLPEHVEMDPIVGTFLKLPSNEPVNVLARVYVIKVRHDDEWTFCLVHFVFYPENN